MPNDSCRVYAAVNQKGGVGKSNLSTNLGIGLARKGQRVLIVDLDSQASQTVSLGWKNPDELNVTVATQLEQVMSGKAFDPHNGILHHVEGVHLLPSSIALSGVEMRLVNAMSRELTLKKCLAPIKSEYDVILLDCPPTLGMMTINALAAADSVIVPVQPEYLSVIGMTQLFETIGLVKENINSDLRVEGVLITLANMRTNLAKNTVEIIKSAYGGNVRVYPEPIPYSTKVKEAGAAGKSIFAYDPKGKAAFAYESLVREVLRDGKSRGTDIRVTKKSEPCR